MVFLGVAHAAVGHHRVGAGLEGGFAGQVFPGVGLTAAFLAPVVKRRRPEGHQVGRLQFGPGFRQRVLNALVHADRTVEHHTFARVFGGPVEGAAAQPDHRCRDQDAFGIEAVQEIAETLALLADQVRFGHRQPVDEHGVGIDALAAHLVDFADLHVVAVQVGIEQRQTVDRFFGFVDILGAGDHQNLVGPLRGRGPDLLAVEDVVITLEHRLGFEARRIQPGVGFGDGETGDVFAFDDGRQPLPFLFLGAEDDDRIEAENADDDGGEAGVRGARFGDRLGQDGGFGDAQAAAAELFRHGDTHPALVGDGPAELFREDAVAVALQPVLIVEALAELGHALFDQLLFGAEIDAHGACSPGSPPVRRVHSAAACLSNASLFAALSRMRSDGPAMTRAATTAPSLE